MAASNLTYLGNRNLKAAGVKLNFTQHQAEEYSKCAESPSYFINNYAKIVSLDDGVVSFKTFPYQDRIINSIHENQNTIGKLFRQSGKSTTVAGYFAWYVLFNSSKVSAVLANKQAVAKEIFSRIQFIIENIPPWLQQGVVEWNKTSFELENGSKCFCAATSPSAIRGFSINLLLLDEFAHLKPDLADEFIASVFPTLSSSEKSKLIIISTPNGLNHFHKMWVDAENGKNDFTTVEGKWQEHPKRNQAWADKQLTKLGEIRYRQEIDCVFSGSSYTLIDGIKLSNIPTIDPIFEKDGFEVYLEPDKERQYVMTVDTSRGRHADFSAFSVFDVSTTPYQVVATYKNNEISTLEYPHIIFNTVRQYNNAYILIEINDLGQEVANILHHDYEYENIYFTKGDVLTNLSGYPGVRTTTKVKSLGCSVLKDLIEKDQLVVNSHNIIQELGIFVMAKRGSYASSDTAINDDLTTTMWLFAWLTKQYIFEELTNINSRELLTKSKDDYINSMLTPFGFYNDGTESHEEIKEFFSGDLWQQVMPTDRNW